MSLKTLFSVATTSATKAITGIAHLGKPVGDVSEWLAEWGENLNSEDAKRVRARERKWELQQREMQLMEEIDEIDLSALKAMKQRVQSIETELEDIFK